MPQWAMPLVWILLSTAGGVLALTVFLHGIGMLGGPGRAVAGWLCRAPGLDVVVALLTWLPWVPAAWFGSWAGVGVAVVGQLIAMSIWVIAHEWAHQEAMAGPRIVKAVNRYVGRWRNHAALWVTVVVLPVFWTIRFGEVVAYPLLVWLLKFPRYKQGEWVNVSRQKFSGLIGHDLIWCLYCDWMTGVYSLGAEMLRNVESFWCPIRFYDGKKCANCTVDFPDIHGGWVAPEGTMKDVDAKMEEMYGSGRREWFGHPARKGEQPAVQVSVEGKASDTRRQTPDSRRQTPDTRLQTPDAGHQTPDAGHQTPDAGRSSPDSTDQT